MKRLTKTYEDKTHGAADDLPCGENSWEYKGLLLEALGKYEDLEEQGLLMKLPCKVGDTVYVKMQFGGYAKGEVRDFTYFVTCGFCVVVTSEKFDKINIPFLEFGKSIFLKEPQE